jgi:hypothetical protein
MGHSEYDPAGKERRPWNVGRMVGASCRARKPTFRDHGSSAGGGVLSAGAFLRGIERRASRHVARLSAQPSRLALGRQSSEADILPGSFSSDVGGWPTLAVELKAEVSGVAGDTDTRPPSDCVGMTASALTNAAALRGGLNATSFWMELAGPIVQYVYANLSISEQVFVRL